MSRVLSLVIKAMALHESVRIVILMGLLHCTKHLRLNQTAYCSVHMEVVQQFRWWHLHALRMGMNRQQ